MENKIRDGVVEIRWLIVIIFITYWAGFLFGVWVMSLPNKNSVNIGSSGGESSIKINQTNP